MGFSATVFKPCFGCLILAVLLSAFCVLAVEDSENLSFSRKVYFGHNINHSDPDRAVRFGFNWTPFPGFKWPPFPWPFPGIKWPPIPWPPIPWPFPGFKWPPIPSPHSPPPPQVKPPSESPSPVYGSTKSMVRVGRTYTDTKTIVMED